MNILYYSPHPHLNLQDPTGYGTHMREMIKAFELTGNEVVPVIMGGDKKKEEGGDGRERIRKFRSYIPGSVWELMKDIRLLCYDRNIKKLLREKIAEFEPDCIYERSNYLQTSGVSAARELNIPHILEVNSPHTLERHVLSGKRPLIGTFAKKIERKQFLQTTKIAAVSSTLRDYIHTEYGVDYDKIKVIPNAIDVDKITVNGVDGDYIRDKYQLRDTTVIGFVGSVHPWHRVDMLVEAFGEIARQRKNIKLLVVGGGSLIPKLSELCRKYTIADDVVFTGRIPQPEVYKYISVMDVTVLPDTQWYMMPVKLFDYGALGKPVIAPDTQAIRDVMVDGEDGILIESNTSSLIHALYELLDDPAKRELYGSNFREKIISQYTWEKNATYVLEQIS